MSKTTAILIFILIMGALVIVVLIAQLPTVITKPVTNWIKSTTSLDLTVIKDKIIAALTGTSALLTGTVTALIYGFWSKGKQLKQEIISHFQTKETATNYIQQLSGQNEQLASTSKSATDKITAEKTDLTTQLSGAKSQLELTAKDLERKTIEAETLSKQAAANFQSALPTNTLYKNAQTGAQIITVEKKVVV